jgi:hypothetical protein
MAGKLLLICGVLASLLYIGSDILAALRWDGYSYLHQSVSELRALGAPTRPLLIPVLGLYALLEIAFGGGVWLSAGSKRSVRLTGGLVIALGVLDLVAIFTPMHVRGAEGTLTDILHIIATVMTVLLFFPIIGFGSAADGRGFRLYSYATLLLLVVFGVWAFMDAPRIGANLPTPWLGVRERLNIYGYMLWMAVLALVLWRAPAPAAAGKSQPSVATPQLTSR